MVGNLIALGLAVAGTALILIAALGIVRLPDLLTRMHASSKAGTLGTALMLVGVAVAFADTAIVMRVLLIILFLFITAPLSAHMIARAGYSRGTPACDETVVDDYAEACGGGEPEARDRSR